MHTTQDFGVTIGIVESLEDPQGLGRVRLTFPNLENQKSNWARLVTPMAGAGRGLFLRPEVGDEVLVVFEQGDLRRPYVLGGLWSKADTPPSDDGQAKANNWRFLRSRSGHVVKLDDTDGAERIEIIDKDGDRMVVIDSANQKIQVSNATGDIEVTASKGKVKVESMNVEVKASQDMNLEATGVMTIKGATVNIN